MVKCIVSFFLLSLCRLISSVAPSANPYDATVFEDVAAADSTRHAMFAAVSAENIKSNLKLVTRKAHQAGTQPNMDVIEGLRSTYEALGYDRVTTSDYQVLLGFPNFTQPNTIHVHAATGGWDLVSPGFGPLLGPQVARDQEDDMRGRIWYSAYSPAGTVHAQIVYAHVGAPSDWAYLDSQGISVRGKIVLLDGYAWLEAEKRGALAAILFNDPASPGLRPPGNFPLNYTFPHSMYFPTTDILRVAESHRDHFWGDILTDFYPSKPYVYRSENVSSLRAKHVLPSVPVLRVSSDAVKSIFERMTDGPAAPPQFTGGIANTVYRLSSSKTFRLSVHAITDPRRTIRNLCAFIDGRSETDRWVLLTNHVDAWTFGAFDPNCGTATLMEVARVLAERRRAGWQPRRTIAVCHFDAEELGMFGSTEWMEEHFSVLHSRAVAAINVDPSVEGNTTFVGIALPLLYQVIADAAKQVPNPIPAEVAQGRPTVFDSWYHYLPHPVDERVPYFGTPRTDSDHMPFIAGAGIPASTFTYICFPIPCYSILHTMYDIEWAMEHFIDPRFAANAAVARVWLEVARSLSDTLVVPFSVRYYPPFIKIYLVQMATYLAANGLTPLLADYAQSLHDLFIVQKQFQARAESVQQLVDTVNSGSRNLTVRQADMLNNRLTQLERCFINPRGIYSQRQMTKHVIFGDSRFGRVSTFPAIFDLVQFFLHAKAAGDSHLAADYVTQIRFAITDIQYAMESALLVLDLDGF